MFLYSQKISFTIQGERQPIFSQAERTIILKALKLNETIGDSKSIKLKDYFLQVYETDILKFINGKV